MSTLKIIHAADLHLDSPFEGLPSGKASVRRGEQRGLLSRLAELALREKADIVLLSGDLLDSDNTYYETGDELIRSLGSMGVPVFIAPGNHDYYSDKSPYARLKLPENVYIFKNGQIECVELPFLGLRVYGAAFTDKRSPALLEGFSAPRQEGTKNLLASTGGFLVWNWVMSRLGAVRATNYVYFQSLITMLAGSVVLHERITWMALLGCVILIGGMVLALGKPARVPAET